MSRKLCFSLNALDQGFQTVKTVVSKFLCFFWLPIFLYFLFINEPGLGVTGIDPEMAKRLFSCSIWKRRDPNPGPFDCEPRTFVKASSHCTHSIIFNTFVSSFMSGSLSMFDTPIKQI